MAKVLVIRKTDRTIHVAPLENMATLKAYNNRSKLGWKFEEMEEDEAKDLPFIDESYVTAAEAQVKVKALETENEEKDALIEKLKAQLAEKLNEGGGSKEDEKRILAKEAIEKINAAANTEEVNAILGNDERVSVKEAAEKKIASFK